MSTYQRIVGTAGLEDLGLLLNREVLPLEVGLDVLRIERGRL
jgi:hypothetical protein